MVCNTVSPVCQLGLKKRCHETPHRPHQCQIQVLGIGKMCLVWCILLISIKKRNRLRFSCISWLAFCYSCCLFSVRYRCIWGRCGWCGRCGFSWHPYRYTTGYKDIRYKIHKITICLFCAYCLLEIFFVLLFLPVRRYASAGYRDRNVSVRLSVCLSVRHAPVLCQNDER